MTDGRLRELERRARESGAIEDETVLLLARVRAGDLDPARLRLAAFCGHPAARLAASNVAEAPTDPVDFVRVLAPWGAEVCLRVAASFVHECLPEFESHQADERPRRAVESVRDWLACPCDAHAVAADGAREGAWVAFQAARHLSGVARAASFLARALGSVSGRDPRGDVRFAVHDAVQAVKFLARRRGALAGRVAAVTLELSNWALA